MRILLAGSRSFGAAVYDMLVEEEHDVVAVWAPPDTEWASPAWVRTPERVKELEVDLIVAAHHQDYITRGTREATRLGCMGFHPSLLPRHRGRDAVRWTVHLRDPIAGGTVYWITDEVDGGPIARQDWIHVDPGWSHSDLWRRLFPLGVRLLRDTVWDIENGSVAHVPQDEQFASWEPSWQRPPLNSN